MRKRNALAFALLFAFGVVAYGFEAPRSAAGHFTFHAFYMFPPTRPAFLRFYLRVLEKTNGRYVPSAIDDFLAGQLWENEGGAEWRAIVAFQLDLGMSRWGDACGRLAESLKQRLIMYILDSIDAGPPQDRAEKLIFVEVLRLGDKPEKIGALVTKEDKRKTVATYNGIHDAEKFAVATAAYRTWAKSGVPDREALPRVDPLQGTGMEVVWHP